MNNNEIKQKHRFELADARGEHNSRVYTSDREKEIDNMLNEARADQDKIATIRERARIKAELETCDDIINDILGDESIQLIMGDEKEQAKIRGEVSKKIIATLIFAISTLDAKKE